MIDSQDLSILHDIAFRNRRSIERIGSEELTRRQVLYSINKINTYILGGKELIKVNAETIEMSDKTEKILQKYIFSPEFFSEIFHSKDYRQLSIMVILAASWDYLSLEHLIQTLDTSRSTILNDLKELKLELKFGLKICYSRKRGYFLKGSEEDIRYMLMKTVIAVLYKNNGELFLKSLIGKLFTLSYNEVEAIILSANQKYQIPFYENNLKEFVYCFIFLNERFKYQQCEEKISSEIIDKTNEYKFSQSICEHYGIRIKNNILYITGWLLGLSTGDIDAQSIDKPVIINIVDGLISRFEALSGSKFSNKQETIRCLYEHIRPSYYRLLFHLPIVNPLASKIEKEYPDLYSLVREAIRPLQSLFGRELPQDEIGFLTIHFAAALFKEQERIIKKNKALIICPSGIGTSLILLRELENLFPSIEFSIYHIKTITDTEQFDLVFTTTMTLDVLNLSIPFIVVNPIMTTKEKLELIESVNALINQETKLDDSILSLLKIVKKYVSEEQLFLIEKEFLKSRTINNPGTNKKEGDDDLLLSEIVDERLVKLNVVASNWEEAIRNSTDVLVKEGFVTSNYIEGMIQTTKEMGPYIVITKHVAMPHARPEKGAKKIGISIATLKNPIAFGNKTNDPVKYIFGLSALDNESHLAAMAELAELLDNEAFYQLLEGATRPAEIIAFIRCYEKERLKDEKRINCM